MDLHAIIPLSIALALFVLTGSLALIDAIRVRRAHRDTRHVERHSRR